MSTASPSWELRPLADERYRALGAQTIGDGPLWLLAALEDAKAAMWEQLELVARVQPDGRDGWDVALDPAVCPVEWLPTAAQLGGVSVAPESLVGASDDYVAAERARAAERPALYTGTDATILAVIRRFLVPSADPAAVIWRPRFDPEHPSADDDDTAYHLTIVIRRGLVREEYISGDEAPELLEAFLEQLPAGIVGHLRISDERDWQEVYTHWPKWQGVHDQNTDWADVLTP